MTDRYIWFFNQVLAGLDGEYADKKICFYIYHTYMEPPVKTKADPRIVGALAPISLCRIHGPGNPVCPESSYYTRLVHSWKPVLNEIYDRGYWFNLADPGLPFSMVHRLRTQIPQAHDMGLTGWRVETISKWASEGPSLYVAARLMWDHQADVDTIMQDFHEKYYGPAAKPMGAYTALMDGALRDGDYHTGGSADLPLFYPKAVRDQAHQLLEQAEELVKGQDEIYARRLSVTRLSFDYLDAFTAMLDHRNAGEFIKAKADLDRYRQIQDQLLTGYDIPMLNKRAATSYTRRFWSLATEQAFDRLNKGGEKVAVLDDAWQFQLDPQGLGMILNWQDSGTTGGNWQTMRTSTQSWSNQGLRYYKGMAWYRQQVVIPEQYKGRRIFLWFGGVDEKAQVWLNGQPLGISSGASFISFEMDATQAIQPGRTNTLTVLVNNQRVDELGTGGITAPVMFYAPAAGVDAVLENMRELGRTFP